MHNDDPSSTNYHLKAVSEDDGPDNVTLLLDLIMRMSELALGTGASASQVTAMALRIMSAHKVRAHLDISYHAVYVSRPARGNQPPITSMRVVHSRITDYTRLAHLLQLADDLSFHRIDVETARERFDEIVVEPREYRPWMVSAATAVLGSSMALLLGGQAVDVVLSFFITWIVVLILRSMSHLVVPAIFINAVAAAIPTALATAALWWMPAGLIPSPSIVVGASLVSMLSGLSLASAVQDAIDGFYVTSGMRFYEAIVSTSGLVLGVMVVLYGCVAMGIPASSNPAVAYGGRPALAVLCGGLLAGAYAVMSYAQPRVVLLSAGFGFACQAVYVLVIGHIQAPLMVTGLAAGLVAFFGSWLASRINVPSLAFIHAGVISMVPGSMIYRGIYALVQGNVDKTMTAVGGALLWNALLIGLAIAIGISLGDLFSRPLTIPTDRAGRAGFLKAWRHGTRLHRRDEIPRTSSS